MSKAPPPARFRVVGALAFMGGYVGLPFALSCCHAEAGHFSARASSASIRS